MSPSAPSGSQIIRGQHRITVLTDGLIRMESAPDGKFEDQASTFAINRSLPTPKYELVTLDDGSLEVTTDKFHLRWDGKAFAPWSLVVMLRDKGSKMGDTNQYRYGDLPKTLGGTYRTLDGVDGRCELGSGVVSQFGMAVIDDSGSMLLTKDGGVAARRAGSTDVYLFTYGLDYRAALDAFYKVSGNTPLIPRWALGNWWSRYYAYTAESYLRLMDKFKEERIPLSVAVLDIDWHLIDVPTDYGTGWTGYTWNEELFPDHVSFLKELHDRKLKATLNTHPADGVRAFEKPYEEMCRALGRDPKSKKPIPFQCTKPSFMENYFKILHHPLEDDGVDFWWLDWQQGADSEAPGIDPLWILNHYHYLDSGRRGDRRFTFSRYAGPGSHRYPIGFSGDTVITWDSLAFQPEFTASASNIGYGWWSHDIGGHYFGIKDNELMSRWVQLGVFSPILRLHSSHSPFNTREPWAFSKTCQAVITKCLQFRHRLLPYLYSAVVRAASGRNIVEPIYYDYPATPEAYRFKNQFFFGGQLLVVPITSPSDPKTGLGQTQGWLPPGRWVDIFTGTVYDGDRILTFHRSVDDYPVFAKDGAIFPLDGRDGADIENGCGIPDHIELNLVVGADGEFELLEDDGTGSDLQEAVISRTPIKYDQGGLTIGPTEHPLLDKRTWSVRLHSYHSQESLWLDTDGVTLAQELSLDEQGRVHLGSFPATATLSLKLPPIPSLTGRDPRPAIFSLLTSAQVEIATKDAIWNIVNQDLDSTSVRLKTLTSLRGVADDGLKSAIEEYLTADLRERT